MRLPWGLQPDIFPALATEPLSVCAMIANRYNPFSYMAAFLRPQQQVEASGWVNPHCAIAVCRAKPYGLVLGSAPNASKRVHSVKSRPIRSRSLFKRLLKDAVSPCCYLQIC